MKPAFFSEGHHLRVAETLRSYLNSLPDYLSEATVESPRAVGDAIERLVAEGLEDLLGEECRWYKADFSRRAIEDIAFRDAQGHYYAVDVKTHREGTGFNMPNLISARRLAKLYEDEKKVFTVLQVRYAIEDREELPRSRLPVVTGVLFAPIENFAWSCLTIGALGEGQIQIRRSEEIVLDRESSRREWMLELCERMLSFYPREIEKLHERIRRFESVRQSWQGRSDDT